LIASLHNHRIWMRQFTDGNGRSWVATVEEHPGPDYKGRYVFAMERQDGDPSPVFLSDVRWNSERTARRTLETMSQAELRRRLRSASGRASLPIPGRSS
jgi:hypothetical protein